MVAAPAVAVVVYQLHGEGPKVEDAHQRVVISDDHHAGGRGVDLEPEGPSPHLGVVGAVDDLVGHQAEGAVESQGVAVHLGADLVVRCGDVLCGGSES